MQVAQFAPFIGQDEYKAIESCFEKKWITEGPKAEEFNKKLRDLLSVPFASFAPNGTLSLYLGLRAMGIQPGDEVIVPDITFIGSATAIEMAGAIPLFADVNRRNYQIDVSSCQYLVTEKTKAIMPVHLYGMSANMSEVMAFAKKNRLMVIEDAAQAIGVKYDGQSCGSIGDVGSFSFFADKTITTGEGGLVVTKDEKIHTSLLYLRNQGRLDRGTFIHPEIGYNFRMTDIQMAIGLVQLSKLGLIAGNKIAIMDKYKMLLGGVEESSFIELEAKSTYIPFRVVIIARKAHELMKFLNENGVQPRSFFYPLHKQPCFQRFKEYSHPNAKWSDKDFPNSMHGYEHGVCLPSFAAMKEEEVVFVCEKIKAFYGR